MTVSLTRHVKVCFLGAAVALMLATATSKPFARTAASADTVRPGLLAYVQETASGLFELRLHDPASKSFEAVSAMADRPALIVWRLDRPVVITVLTDTSYSTAYLKKPYVSNPIGDQAPKGLEVLDGWIDKDGKRLVVLGWSSPAANAKLTCVLYRVPTKGPWRKTKSSVAKFDGITVSCNELASRHRVTTFSVSNPQLMGPYQCAGEGSVCDRTGKKRPEAAESAKASIMEVDKNFVSADFADPGNTPYFLGFGVTMGDSPHLMGPVHVLQRDGKAAKAATLEAPASVQVQAGIKGSLILVAEEYSGDNPILFDAQTGQVVWSPGGAFAAVWLP
jgi:hypothetical protein